MKNLSLFLRRWQLPLLLLLSVMPAVLAVLCTNAPEALGASGALFAAYAVVSGVCCFVPGSRRIPAGVLGSAAIVLLSAMLLPLRAQHSLLLLPFALIALLFFSFPLASRQYESEIPPFVYFFGVGVHVVVQFLKHYFYGYAGVSPYAQVESALTASLIGYILLFLLSMNRISLDNATLARHRLPASMRRFNTVLTLGFLALALLLSSLPAVASALRTIRHTLTAAIARLFAWLLSLLPSVPDMGGGASEGSGAITGFPIEAAPPSAFALFMQKVATVLTALLLAGGTLFLVYRLIQQLRRLLRHLNKQLRQYVAAAATDYDDEITDTREDGAARESRFTRRVRHRVAFDATPAGHIRQIYARLLRRHSAWSDSSTARENLPEEAAALYEQARYSEHPVTEEDADRFAAETKKV